MALRDTWHRALVYFGLAEDPDYGEHDVYEPDTAPHGQVYEAARAALGDRQPDLRAAPLARRDRRHLRRRRAAGAARVLRPVAATAAPTSRSTS